MRNCSKLKQALKEQQSALDLALGPEGKGNVRATLVAACAFSLADMLVAERRLNETKVCLATAYDAIKRTEGKGGPVRALMNYAYVLRNDGKPRSARDTYKAALEQARADFGPCHANVEQVKYEYSAFLSKIGRTKECSELLVSAADDLIAKSDSLDKEAEEKKNDEANKEKKVDNESSNLPGLTAEEEQTPEQSAQSLSPGKLARHFAMRNLMNAAGVLDTRGEHEEAQVLLARALELAIEVHGENSVQHMNALYAIGIHCKNRGAIDEAIQAHEGVLSIMDSTIEVYEPDLLQNRIAILRDTAILYDQKGHPDIAIEYAEGALVNAQTLSKIMVPARGGQSARAKILEPYWHLMAELKMKVGDVAGANEAKREALKGKLNQGMGTRGGRGVGVAPKGLKRAQAGASTRAGGRRV